MSSETIGKHRSIETDIELFESLQQIQEDINTAIDLQDVLDRILRGAVTLVGARDGSLMLIEEDELCFRARFGGSLPKGKVERTFRPGEGIAGWVVENHKPYLCRDTNLDKLFEPIIGGEPIRSLVSVPIVSHGTVLGVINVDSKEPNRFSGSDAQLLVNLAGQTAAAIERAELWDSLRQMVEKTAGDTDDLYEHIVDSVHRLTRCPVALWQVDETNRTQATIRTHRGLREDYANTRVLDLKHSVTGKVIQTARPIEVEDIEEDLDISPETKVEAGQQGWKSMLVVPLLAGFQQAVGSLSIYSFVEKKFAPWEIDLLRTFASQAGMAVQNATRIQTIQRLNQVGQSLTTLQKSPEVLEETLRRIANAALEVLGADIVDLYQYRADIDRFDLPPIMVGKRNYPDIIPKRILPDDVVVQIVRSGEAIYASDAQVHEVLAGEWETPREGWPEERFVMREGSLSSAAVPMLVDGEIVGILFASYRQKRDFDLDLELRERIGVFTRQGAVAISNARLVQELRERADEIDLLQSVGAQIGKTLNLGQILPPLVEGAMRLTKTKSGVVHVLESSGKKIANSYGYPEAFRHPPPRISEQGYTRYIIDNGEQVVITDVHEDTKANPEVVKKGVLSFVGTPLKLEGGRVVGVLYVNDASLRQYPERELSLLRALADQAAIAVKNAQLLSQLVRLQEVTATISAEPTETSKVLELVVHNLSDIFQEASCAIRLYNPSDDSFSPLTSTGILDEFVGYPPRSVGTSRHVIETKTPLYIADVLDIPSDGVPSVRRAVVERDIRAFAVLPLLRGDRAIGVLYVALGTPYQFSTNDRQILELFAGQAATAIENAQQRGRDIASLQRVNEAITTAPWTDIAALISQVAKDLTQSEYSGLWRVEGNRLVPGAMYGTELMDIPGLPIDETSINAWVAQTGEPYVCLDIDKDPHYLMWREDVRSSMAVPMKLRGEVVGTLAAESTRENAFSQYHVDLLQSLADQAAIAFENARLYEQRQADIAALQEINEAVISQNLDEVLDLIVKRAIAVMPGEYCELWLIESPSGDLVLRSVDGPESARDAAREIGRLRANQPGTNLRVARQAESYIWKGKEADADFLQIYEAAQSAVIVPLKYRGEVIGTLNVESSKPAAFTEEHKALLDSFADQAAIAIENTRLFTQTQEQANILRALYETGKDITSILDLRGLLKQIVERARELTGADKAQILHVDTENEKLLAVVGTGFTHGQIKNTTYQEICDGISGWVLREGIPTIAEDILTDPRNTGLALESARSEHPRGKSVAIAPLIVKDRAIGTITVVNNVGKPVFGREDLDFVIMLANQAAVALENARLYEHISQDLERRIRELEVLTEIGRTISSLGIDQILDLVYKKMGRIIDLSDAQVQFAFYDGTKDEVSFPLAVEQDNGEIIDVVRWSKREALYRQLGEGETVEQFRPRARREPPRLNEYVIRSREPLLIVEDFEQKAADKGIGVWPTFGRLDRPTDSWLGVPMMVGGRVTGVISIQSLEQEHAFDQDHVEVLTAIANQAGVAIENARLYESLAREQHRRISAEKFGYLGVVAAGLAHRLNSVGGMVRLCERELRGLVGPENKDIEDNLDTIAEETGYMLALAEGLFTPTQALEERMEPTDLNLLLKDAISNAYVPSKIEVVLDCADGLPLIPANKWFVEMFVELIRNAVKAMDSVGQLEVGSKLADDGWVEAWISDTGRGIPLEDRERIFELFYSQPGMKEDEQAKGFGFGLWWIKTFLLGIGGSIECESEVETGTTFSVKLPV